MASSTAEVSNWLVTEKVYKRFMSAEQGGGAPQMDLVRAARVNIRYHLRYIGYLVGRRNWLAGSEMTYADLAAAAHLSSVDFLGDVPWGEDEMAKHWYARVKSRPGFRGLLADRVPGITPADAYGRPGFLIGPPSEPTTCTPPLMVEEARSASRTTRLQNARSRDHLVVRDAPAALLTMRLRVRLRCRHADLKSRLVAKAESLGFDLCRVTLPGRHSPKRLPACAPS